MAIDHYKLINPNADYLNLKEVGKLFSPPISYVSLWKWQKEGKIKLNPIKIGSKIFYKKSEVIEVIESMSNNKLMSYE